MLLAPFSSAAQRLRCDAHRRPRLPVPSFRRDIVRTAQAAGLSEANGFDATYIASMSKNGVTYSNEYDFDFFLVRP